MPAQTAVRFSLEESAKPAYSAMLALDSRSGELPLDTGLRRLLELRISQINGCAYCLAMHTVEARAAGVDESRLATVAGWRESPFFSAGERAALALAETITHVDRAGIPQEVWDAALAEHEESGAVAILWTATVMNAWNRLAIASGIQADPVS